MPPKTSFLKTAKIHPGDLACNRDIAGSRQVFPYGYGWCESCWQWYVGKAQDYQCIHPDYEVVVPPWDLWQRCGPQMTLALGLERALLAPAERALLAPVGVEDGFDPQFGERL